MKAVLLSIKPKYCELIASGQKEVEIRKNRPKIDMPFKVYMYCTIGDINIYGDSNSCITDCNKFLKNGGIEAFKKTSQMNLWNGKVIGEFVCDTMIIDHTFGHDELLSAIACLDVAEIAAYCTNDPMYAWHISDLVIYDEPKELSEFLKYNYIIKKCSLTRPPQSWCYVEELEEY